MGDYLIFTVFIVIILFLITRSFWCWYWKINIIIKLLEGQNNLLYEIVSMNETNETSEENTETVEDLKKNFSLLSYIFGGKKTSA